MPSSYKLVPIKPVSGIFDARSLPDQIGSGSFTLVKNMSVRAIGRRCRRGGWKKFLDGVNESYNNESLCDQLIGEQLYYEGYSKFLHGGGEFDHYSYLYYAPDALTPGSTVITLSEHCGYAYESKFPRVFTPDACWVYEQFAGYPYSLLTWPLHNVNECLVVKNIPDNPEFTTTYQGSYYHLTCNQTIDPALVVGYPYGPYVGIYDPEFGYTVDYCGAVPLRRGGCREAITYLAEFRSPRNFRKLVAGTKSRLYALNEPTGNWRILADGLGGTVDRAADCAGCSQRRFLSAQLDSILVLTNQFDPILYWYFDDSPQPGDGSNCDLWSARPIPDLQDLNVTKAGCVCEFKGFMFLADVEQDGAYYPHRVIWSDYKNPISYIPTTDSLAGFQDIGSGERILRMEVLGDYLYVYSDQAIHRASLVSTGETFNFEQLYRGQDACKYKFSLVNTGTEHIFLSADKLMVMTLSNGDPIEVGWMRATSKLIFDGISEFETSYGSLNNDQCDLVTGGYNSILKELWFSWPTGENSCPDVSVVFNLTKGQEAADLVDHGFTAFCVYESDRLPTVADWFVQMGICTRGQLPPSIKEGDPAPDEIVPIAAPTSIWNATENPDLPADPHSLCAALANKYAEDFCAGCTGVRRFVMASAVDKCLKEYADSTYYREMVEHGVYVLNGYDSILGSGSENLKIDQEKVCKGLKAEFRAEHQTTPSTLLCWLGYGAEASCMRFKHLRTVNPDMTTSEGIELRCLTNETEAQHDSDNTRASVPAYFNAAVRGRFLAYRLKISGTGGGSCFSSVWLDIAKAEAG